MGIPRIDFLKIDVEGNELEVLKGSEKMLLDNSIHIIQLEYGGTYIDANIFLKNVFEYLEKFELSLYKILFGKIELVNYHKDLENFQYCNYLIINNKFKK